MPARYANLLISALAILPALSACQKNEPATSRAGAVIYLADAGPLSGHAAALGRDSNHGAQLAVDDINAAGGVKLDGQSYRLELLSEDDAAQSKSGTDAAQKIIDHGKVSAVIGHVNSGVTMMANPLYAQAGIVMITPTATHPDIVRQAPKIAGRLNSVYRMVANDDRQGRALAAYAAKLGVKRLAVLDDGTTYGKGMAERVAEAARSQGVAVVYRQAVSDKTIDFKPVLANIQAKHADAYTWGGLADTAAVLVKQAQESGMRQTAFMPDAVCTETFIRLSGKAGEGTICSTTTTATADLNNGEAFRQRFEAKYPNEPLQSFAPLAYDAVQTAVAAIRKAGSGDATDRFEPTALAGRGHFYGEPQSPQTSCVLAALADQHDVDDHLLGHAARHARVTAQLLLRCAWLEDNELLRVGGILGIEDAPDIALLDPRNRAQQSLQRLDDLALYVSHWHIRAPRRR